VIDHVDAIPTGYHTGEFPVWKPWQIASITFADFKIGKSGFALFNLTRRVVKTDLVVGQKTNQTGGTACPNAKVKVKDWFISKLRGHRQKGPLLSSVNEGTNGAVEPREMPIGVDRFVAIYKSARTLTVQLKTVTPDKSDGNQTFSSAECPDSDTRNAQRHRGYETWPLAPDYIHWPK
jgi:hypothetical protein